MCSVGVDTVVIGNILKETIVYPDRSVGPVLGSPCAYTSLAMAKLGLRVGMVTYYGNDCPEEMISELKLIDRRGFIPYNYTTENHLIYKEDGGKSVEYYRTAPVIQFEHLPYEYRQARLYFICPMNYEVSINLCESLNGLGKKVMVDLGGFGGTTVYNRFTIDTPRGNYYIRSLCQCADIIKASEEDLSLMAPDLPLAQISQRLVDYGAKIVLITRGEHGACYQIGEQPLQYADAFVPRVPQAQCNVVGAGDVFVGGFIYRYLQCEEIGDAVLYANAVASLVLEKEGTCIESRMPSSEIAQLRRDRII